MTINIFTAQDSGVVPIDASFPNSDAERKTFLAAASAFGAHSTHGIGHQIVGDTSGIWLNGDGAWSYSGSYLADYSGVNDTQTGLATDGFQAFNRGGDSQNWLALDGAGTSITFNNNYLTNSFGAYFTGLSGTVVIKFNDGTNQLLTIPSLGSSGGVEYWGFTDTSTFSSFTITDVSGDSFGIDGISFNDATPTPAPSFPQNAGNVDEWILSNGQWQASEAPGSHPTGSNVAGVGDWTGNGTDGLLWYNATTGEVDEWQLSDTQWAASVDLGTHPGNYQIAGVGHFTGSGVSDVLWTSASGNGVLTDIWQLGLNGQWTESISPGSHPAGYSVAGVGDWTGHGTDGILWYNSSTGDVDEWQLSGGKWTASVDLGAHPGSGWIIAGVGDFNSDLVDDVLWTHVNVDGTVSTDIWELGSNGQWISSVSPGTHPAGYQVVGIGDFNGDGTSDILWQNSTTGDVDEWLINNGQWAGSVDLGTHPGNFQIAGLGSFTGNGTSGILWHAST